MVNRNQLIEDNINLVYSVISKHYPGFIKDEDIVQCGMMGLVKAANKWDESKSSFSTYAFTSILNEIRMEFRKRCRQPKTLSLDYEYSSKDGDSTTLADVLVGDLDVDYVDTVPVCNKLKPKELMVFKLLKEGNSGSDIARMIGMTRQNVNKYVRKIRALIKEEEC